MRGITVPFVVPSLSLPQARALTKGAPHMLQKNSASFFMEGGGSMNATTLWLPRICHKVGVLFFEGKGQSGFLLPLTMPPIFICVQQFPRFSQPSTYSDPYPYPPVPKGELYSYPLGGKRTPVPCTLSPDTFSSLTLAAPIFLVGIWRQSRFIFPLGVRPRRYSRRIFSLPKHQSCALIFVYNLLSNSGFFSTKK